MGREASGVAEKPGGESQGVHGGVELPQSIDTPRVAELPWGGKTPGVTTKGEGVPGEDRRGQGGDGNPPTTRATEACRAGGRDEEKTGGPGTAAPPRPQRGMAADRDSKGARIRHTAGTDGTRTEHCALVRREYGLLVMTGPTVNPAAAGDQGSGDGHEDTRGTSEHARRETEVGDGTRQRALPVRGMQGANNEERRPPERSRVLNACSHQGRGGGRGPPT